MPETCEGCRFWYAMKTAGRGECHRYPPLIVSSLLSWSLRESPALSWCDHISEGTAHPIVRSSDTCGEHQPKENQDGK
jgi:hypothetical protein